jgi:hypothetical protein
MEPIEKVNGCCITNIKTDRSVGTACDIVISTLRADIDPGELALNVLRILTDIRLLLGKAFIVGPKLEFAS